MKNKFIIALAMLFMGTAKAQKVEQIVSYNKLGTSRLMTLMSDNSISWYKQQKGWETLDLGQIPIGKMLSIDVYLKSSFNQRLVALMEDHTFWWYREGWNSVGIEGLPRGFQVKDYKSYAKFGKLGAPDERIVALLQDNSIWWCENNWSWKKNSSRGLPQGVGIDRIRTFQKFSLRGSETRFVAKLENNSIYWFSSKGAAWNKYQNSGLPAGKSIQHFEVYMKNVSGLSGEGRMLSVLDDQTIWWSSTENEGWTKISSHGLPEGYKVQALNVYQKFETLESFSRLVVLLNDDTLWWFSEEKGWSKVPV